MDRKQLGANGEEHAWMLLKQRGDKLVTRNFNCTVGELDLVTWHAKTLVFTEVRLRSSAKFGNATESIGRGKQTKVRRAAEFFLGKHFNGKPLPDCRFDVIWIVQRGGEIAESGIIEGAF